MPYRSIKNGDGELPTQKGQRTLTPKMRSFINAYFGEANFNSMKAIELSDYKCSTRGSMHQMAAELMIHPSVVAEINRRNEAREKKSEIKSEYLLSKLIEIIDEHKQEEKTADRLRAIELAGKAIAIWKERQEVSGPDGGAIQHEQHVKESVADFTNKIAGLASKSSGISSQSDSGTENNVVSLPVRSGTGGA